MPRNDVPSLLEVEEAIRGMANKKANGPDVNRACGHVVSRKVRN